jgi:type I restriction enzyme S subunit
MTNGWKTEFFEDCIEKVTYTQKIQRKDFLNEGAHPVVSQEEGLINGYWNKKADLFRVSTPIVVFGDHTKVLKYVDFDFVLGADGVKILQPRAFLIPKFFFYQLQAANLDSLGYARHYKLLKELQIAYPMHQEQQRIVGILDEAFEGIATAKANAERNLQNARALFESHVESVFTQRGKEWVERSLGECVEDVSTGPFGSLLHKSDYQSGGIPLVNPINIEGEEIFPDDRKAVGTLTAQRLARYALRENDIVIARRGEIGRCAVVSREQSGWLCGTGCFVIRPSDKTDPYFLTHLLRSRPYREKLEGTAERATMPSISNNDLANLLIWLPPVPQQRRMLNLIEELSRETQRLALLYERKFTALEALKKSLLHQAFTGELTSQPEQLLEEGAA